MLEIGWLLVGLLAGVGVAGAGLRAYAETPQGCPHPRWVEVNRIFAPGSRLAKIPITSFPPEQEWIREQLHGMTSVEYRCERCNAPNEVKMTGDHTSVAWHG